MQQQQQQRQQQQPRIESKITMCVAIDESKKKEGRKNTMYWSTVLGIACLILLL